MKQALVKGLVLTVIAATVQVVRAEEMLVLSARESDPGEVIVTFAVPATITPKADEVSLQLDNTPLIKAKAGSVSSLGSPAGPAWLMLCIDRSGSIGQPVLDGLKVGLSKALVEGRTGNLPFKVAMVAFASDAKHILDFTGDPRQVATAVRGLTLDRTPNGQTKLHDAISAGLAALKGQGEGSKRLIVVSDGKDEGSAVASAQLATAAKGPPRITIDALALGALAQDHAGAISSVAGLSGGRFLPSADVKDVAQPLQRLISDATRLSRFDVAFAYSPAADKRTAQLAALQFTPAGGTQVRAVLNAALVAQAAPVEEKKSPEPTPTPSPPPPQEVNFTLELVINWLKNAPAALAWAAALLLAAALGVMARRVYVRRTLIVRREEVNVIVPPPPPAPSRARAPTAVGHSWRAPSPGHPVATLRGIAGAARGQLVHVDKPLFRIGCDPGNDLILVGDDFASAAHALLRFEAGLLYVEDVGSRNGTHLNGGSFKSATRVLNPGDELRFGHTTYQVLAPLQQAASGPSGFESPPG
jgi:hypothetical protein